ncbi:DUF4902 domain-containing protein [Collimonas humicola]|uniref:DUF4902 domain-containing protein n=1 Tax=Collimonas humicola TaxID=2825886 RepID=UPI001B8C2393|nr:DUF4902 domain-containing protein [Collimonas humicola]
MNISAIRISPDGYFRLQLSAFRELPFKQLIANADADLLRDLLKQTLPAQLAGFCKLASEGVPGLDIEFDWYVHGGTKLIMIVAPSIRTNLMLVTGAGGDYGLARTRRLVSAWIKTFFRPPHDRLNAHSELSIAKRAILTDGEREILHWAAKGKTAWEISMITNVSERTTAHRWSSVIRKLGASNMVQAAITALSLGLLR